jgi:hypothetical protein
LLPKPPLLKPPKPPLSKPPPPPPLNKPRRQALWKLVGLPQTPLLPLLLLRQKQFKPPHSNQVFLKLLVEEFKVFLSSRKLNLKL